MPQLIAFIFIVLSALSFAGEPKLKSHAVEIESIIKNRSLVRPKAEDLNQLIQCRVADLVGPRNTQLSKEDYKALSGEKCDEAFCTGNVAPFESILERVKQSNLKKIKWLEAQKEAPLTLSSKETIPNPILWKKPADTTAELESRWKKILLFSFISQVKQNQISPTNAKELKKLQEALIENSIAGLQQANTEIQQLTPEKKEELYIHARVTCADKYSAFHPKLGDDAPALPAFSKPTVTIGFKAVFQADPSGGSTYVAALVPGSAAAEPDKLKRGDELLSAKVDGKSYDLKKAAGRKAFFELPTVNKKAFQLTVLRNGEKQTVDLESRASIGFDELVRDTDREVSGKIIRHIALPSFIGADPNNLKGESTYEQTDRAMREPGNFDAVVLDLRSNPGGAAMEAKLISGMFLDAHMHPLTTAVIRDGDKGHSFLESSGSDNPYMHIPLFILTNKKSASASEILAKSLKDAGRAVIVGENTFGKGIQQTPHNLQDGSFLMLTDLIRTGIDGSPLHIKGVSPHLNVRSLFGTDPAAGEDLEVTVPTVQDPQPEIKRVGSSWKVDADVIKATEAEMAKKLSAMPAYKDFNKALGKLDRLNRQPISLNYQTNAEDSDEFNQAVGVVKALGGSDSANSFDNLGFSSFVALDTVSQYLKLEKKK